MNGLLSYLKALNGIGKYGLWKYFLLSGFISFLIAAGVASASIYLGDGLGDWIQGVYPWETGSSIVGRIGDWASGIVVFVLGLFFLKYILLIVMSPIMSFMSDSIERQINDDYVSPKFTMTTFVSDLVRSLKINLRNLSKELLIISLFPGAAFVTTPLIFLVQAYYAGFGLLDYWMERHYRVADSIGYVRSRRMDSVGIGGIYIALLLLPFIGAVIAPVLGATAATIYAVDNN